MKTSNSLPPFKLKRGEIYARKKTEEALRQKLDEVKRFNKLMVGREPAIIKVGAVS